MIKKLLVLVLVAIAAIPALAADDNTLVARPLTTSAGSKEVKMTVDLKNVASISDLQFDLYLPEGVEIAYDEDDFALIELNTSRTTSRNHTVDFLERPDGSTRIMCTSSKGISFSGNDGGVVDIYLNVADDLEEGDYTATLKYIVVSNAEDTYTPANTTSTITIQAAGPEPEPEYTDGYGVEVAPFAIVAGSEDNEVPVLMNNLEPGEISSVEFDLYLPKGLSLYEEDGEYVVDAGSRFASNTIKNRFACDVDENTDGSLHLSAYFTRTSASYVFSGTSGDIMLLTLLGDENLKDDIYELEIKNIVLNDDSDIKVRPYKASVFVGKPQIKEATLYGTYDSDAIDILNESLSTDASLTYLDMSNAKVEDDAEITLANKNAIIYVKEGTQLANEDNVVIGDICDNLTLVDKVPFAAPKAFSATTATYTRTLPDGEGWNSAVLPYEFDVTADMEVINNAVLNGSSINFSEVATDETIPANTPFLYRKVGGGTITIENVDVEIAPCETTPASGALLGTYVAIPKGEATGKLIMTQDGMDFATASAQASIPAFRAYLNGGAGSQVFTITVGDELTGIVGAGADINEKVDVYTASGQLIRTQVEAITALQGLESGIYIINGNKIKK